MNERLRAGERQDMDALQLRCHTEWLEDTGQVMDQMRLSTHLVPRRNWVTRNAFLTRRAVCGVRRLDSLPTMRNINTNPSNCVPEPTMHRTQNVSLVRRLLRTRSSVIYIGNQACVSAENRGKEYHVPTSNHPSWAQRMLPNDRRTLYRGTRARK